MVIIRKGLVILFLFFSDHAPLEVGAASFWSKPDRLVEVSGRLVSLLAGSPGEAAADIRGDLPRIEPDHLRKIGDGRFRVSLVDKRVTTAAARVHVVRIEPDRLAEVGNGLVVLTLFAPGMAAMEVRDRIA